MDTYNMELSQDTLEKPRLERANPNGLMPLLIFEEITEPPRKVIRIQMPNELIEPLENEMPRIPRALKRTFAEMCPDDTLDVPQMERSLTEMSPKPQMERSLTAMSP